MRRILFAVVATLAVAAAVLSYPQAAVAGPPTSAQTAARIESRAEEAALALAHRVGTYGNLRPEAPGALPVMGAPGLHPSGALLVHSYPDLTLSYTLVTLESDLGRAFIVLDPTGTSWRAYGEIPAGRTAPSVDRGAAALAASAYANTDVSAADLIVVERGKTLWWHAPNRAESVFVSVNDATDVREDVPEVGLDLHHVADDRARAGGLPIRSDSRQRLPTSYDIPGVPHYYQQTNYFCGPAALEMVFDYWGPHVGQYDVSYAANTQPVTGTPRSDVRRAAHFSSASTAAQDPTLVGYDERSLGYGGIEHYWSYEPGDSTRYTDLKELVSSDYPVLLLMWFSEAHQSGHYRVLKGYDDVTDVFVAHDPWYTPPYQGPDVHFNQAFFVDDLWTVVNRWGLMVTPWMSVAYPTELVANDTTTVTALVTYTAPYPFEGVWEVTDPTATLSLPPSLSLAPGETASKLVAGLASSGSFGTATWRIVAEGTVTGLEAHITASGLVSGSSSSYPAYSDSIGGTTTVTFDVVTSSPTLITIDHAGGGDQESIWEGLYCADDGDTLMVAAGVYSGPLNRDISFEGRNVVLLSEGGPDSTIIDCGNRGRGFLLDDGEDTATIIEGFTITGGSSPDNYGGGIVCEGGASPTIRDCVVSDCSASLFGGGIYCDGGSSPTIDRVVLFRNSSLTGSGLYCRTAASPVVTHCTIAGNSSNQVTASDASPAITNSIIAFSVNGRGVVCQGSADPHVTRSCMFGNAQGDSLCGSYHDNMFVDPLFCDLNEGVVSLHDDSPCLPAGNIWGELIGAEGAGGCGTGILDAGITKLALSPAHPNPFRAETCFVLQTAAGDEVVVVSVHDAAGRRVKTIFEGTCSGRRLLSWDGTDERGNDVATGIYFVKASGGVDIARKAVLLR